MSRLTDSLRNVFKIEELRQRIIFTALMLLVVRIGSFISVPGLDVKSLAIGKSADGNSLFGLIDMFTGGAYSMGAIFARLPHALMQEFKLVTSGGRNIIVELVILTSLLGVIAVVVLFTQARRKIPVMYAKRMVGDKTVGAPNSHIPMQLITANVMPI